MLIDMKANIIEEWCRTCCSTLSAVSFSKAETYCDNLISGTEEADESFPPIFEIFERSG
jgi:hypothetical protein